MLDPDGQFEYLLSAHHLSLCLLAFEFMTDFIIGNEDLSLPKGIFSLLAIRVHPFYTPPSAAQGIENVEYAHNTVAECIYDSCLPMSHRRIFEAPSLLRNMS
jgi:hypothetical protein